MEKFILDLIAQIRSSSKVFITGHKNADADAIASSIAIAELCSILGKEAYIILDDPRLEMVTERIFNKAKEKYHFIRRRDYERLVDSRSSLIMSDVNKDYLIPIEAFGTVSIIDHHDGDQFTVESDNKYIDSNTSSASEILFKIFNKLNVDIEEDLATYLLAGIYLDTNHFKRNVSDETKACIEKLLDLGAKIEEIEELFKEDEETIQRITNLAVNGTIIKEYIDSGLTVSFTLNRERPNTIYLGEDIAKVADMNLEKGVDASFTIGYVDDGIVKVSARGKDNIHVGSVMQQMLGGGNAHSGATQLEEDDILIIEDELEAIINNKLGETPKTR